MIFLEQTMRRYEKYPAMALLRALEIERFREDVSVYSHPVLDLGCGDGYMAKMAFNESICAGIDIDFQALGMARLSGSYRITLAADARYLPFKDGAFGTIYSNCAIEHMQGMDLVLAEIKRLLKKDGSLVILVPSGSLLKPPGRLSGFFGQSVWDKFNRLQGHLNLFDPEVWIRRLSDLGLKVISISPYGDHAIASRINDFDLMGKLHFDLRAPFLHLRHDGNIGQVIAGFVRRYLKNKFSGYKDTGKNGYYLMIIAVKE